MIIVTRACTAVSTVNDPATGATTTGAEAPSVSDMILVLASNLNK